MKCLGHLVATEMERDCMISYGLAKFLKERLLETADLYDTYVCNDCGLFAQRMLRKDNKPYATKKDIYYCPACRNSTNVSKIRIPYAFKLLIQELLSMNICPRIRTKGNSFDWFIYLNKLFEFNSLRSAYCIRMKNI